MMNTLLCAIDPGAAGGIAWIEPGKGVQAVKMPDTDESLLALALRIKAAALVPGKVHVLIEEVGGYVKPRRRPGRGNDCCPRCGKPEEDEGQPGSRMFSFGENAGLVRGVFLGVGAKVELVRPQVWQKMLFSKRGDREKAEWKRELKGHAQRFFPGLKVTLQTADALCILRHGMNVAGLPRVEVIGAVPEPSKRPAFTVLDELGKWEQGEARNLELVQRRSFEVETSIKVQPVLFLGDLHGKPMVFKRLQSGTAVIVRKAAGEDFKLPKLKDLPQ